MRCFVLDFNNSAVYKKLLEEQAVITEQLCERKKAMHKMLKKEKPFIKITSIEFKRIILHLKGEIVNLDHAKKYGIRFVSPQRDGMFYPDHFDVDEDGKFSISLNIMCSNNEQPLQNGRYDLVLFEEYENHRSEISFDHKDNDTIVKYGENVYHMKYDEAGYVQSKEFITHEYPAFIDSTIQHLCDNTADNPWNFKVNKTKSSWLRVVSHEDVDNFQFYLTVSYKPFQNYGVLFLRRKQIWRKRKQFFISIKGNLMKDFSDLKMLVFKSLHKFFQKFAKHNGDIILFCSASRAEIGGNEKIIYDRMLERGLDQKFQFRFDFKESITTNRSIWQMIKFNYYLATSDVIVLDDYYPIIYDVTYDKRVKVVQVWHACGAFKTVGFERIGKKDAPHFNSQTHKCYTHVIVSSEISARHNAEAFCISESKFYTTGIPRTDLFFHEEYKKLTTEKMLEAFPQCKNKNKVYLYAPTFRGTNANNADFPFGVIDLEKWGKLLEEENSVLIVKLHPFVTKHIDIPPQYKNRIFDATHYREINDILFISDVLITDYSSVIYEMSLLNKPMIFYAFDQHSYEISRDFYEPYADTVPGKIVHDFDDLMECLKNDDYEFEKMQDFVKKNFKYTDGKSTDRVIDQIFLDKSEDVTCLESTLSEKEDNKRLVKNEIPSSVMQKKPSGFV